MRHSPVAMMTLWAFTTRDVDRTTKGRVEKSTDSTSSVSKTAPHLSPCSRMLFIRSGPVMPCGKPGKFSTCGETQRDTGKYNTVWVKIQGGMEKMRCGMGQTQCGAGKKQCGVDKIQILWYGKK